MTTTESVLAEHTTEAEIAFTAGVLAGDGSFAIARRQDGAHVLVLCLMMKDHATVRRVARCLAAIVRDVPYSGRGRKPNPGVTVYRQVHAKGGEYSRIWLSSDKAVAASRRLLSPLGDSDKATQLREKCAILEITLE